MTEETATVLRKLGYSCDCRGFINVKGKGELKTFFVCTDTSKQQSMGLSWGQAPPDQELIGSCAQQCRCYSKDCNSRAPFITLASYGWLLLHHLSLLYTISTNWCCFCLRYLWYRVCVFTALMSITAGFKDPSSYTKPMDSGWILTRHPFWVLVEKGYTLLLLCNEHDNCELFHCQEQALQKILRNCSLNFWLFICRKY